MSVPLTARQLEHEAELAAALPRQPAVIQFVVRWAAGKILEEREACAALAQSKAPGWTCVSEHDHDADGWAPECIAAAIRARR